MSLITLCLLSVNWGSEQDVEGDSCSLLLLTDGRYNSALAVIRSPSKFCSEKGDVIPHSTYISCMTPVMEAGSWLVKDCK